MKDYVFRQRRDNRLEFVGDFESLYQTDKDPWNQSGEDGEISAYYVASRARLISVVQGHLHELPTRLTGLEIGCGHGHVTNVLSEIVGGKWTGMDISPTAIKQAYALFPKKSFMTGDITLPSFVLNNKFDIVILGQLLWYVMHQMETVLMNCHRLLNPEGILIVSQAFLREQLYGKDIIDGFPGLLEMFMKYYPQRYTLVEARYDDTQRYLHHDGVLALRKVG